APIGYPNVPEITFGASAELSYKNFDLSFLFQGVSDVSTYYGVNGGWLVFPRGIFTKRDLGDWSPERVAKGEPITFPRLTTQTSPNELSNSFFIVNSNYIRLKNVQLGYRLPKQICKKIGAKAIRFYINGLNLITW